MPALWAALFVVDQVKRRLRPCARFGGVLIGRLLNSDQKKTDDYVLLLFLDETKHVAHW
jgi:hypothetical protein